jgi:hypothetical protein
VSDERGRPSAGGYMARDPHWITRGNVWRSVTSCGLFVRRAAHERIGGFDEQLGLGAGTPWGSGEETDYVLQALRERLLIFYEPSLRVFHPRKAAPLCRATLTRSWLYGKGAGYVLRKHGYGTASALYFGALPVASAAKAVLQAEPGRAIDRLVTSTARLIGWSTAASWRKAHATRSHEQARVRSMNVEPKTSATTAREPVAAPIDASA